MIPDFPCFSILIIFAAITSTASQKFFDSEKCGIMSAPTHTFKSANIDNIITGGHDAQFDKYPGVVGIFRIVNDKPVYMCSGALIHNNTVVTAAHCFQDPSQKSHLTKICGDDLECRMSYIGLPIERFKNESHKELCESGFFDAEAIKKNFVVSAGTTKIQEAKTEKFQFKIKDVSPIYQKFYERGCMQNDIALLKVENIHQHVHHSCPVARTPVILKKLLDLSAVGWGSDPKEAVRTHKDLQVLGVGALLDRENCTKLMNGKMVIDGICVAEKAEFNTCQGDSGSPLLYNGPESSDRQVVVGVLSYGSDCQELLDGKEQPKAGVYTRLDYYATVINDYIGQNGAYDDLSFTNEIVNMVVR